MLQLRLAGPGPCLLLVLYRQDDKAICDLADGICWAARDKHYETHTTIYRSRAWCDHLW